jgi:hypothetical protein
MSDPNTWAKATVQNNWGSQITNVFLYHRYDEDHFDQGHWDNIDNGSEGSSFNVGYWTGLWRTGKDYWLVEFTADDGTWTCKPNFYCYLTEDDKDKLVVCSVQKESLKVAPPESSNCSVSLYRIARSAEQVAAR